jgi:hypothetical protein
MSGNNICCDNSGPDVFIGELTRVERIGANRRLIFTMPDPMDPRCRAIVAKLIVPAEYMATLAYMLAGDGAKPPLADELFSAMQPTGATN